MALCRIIKSLKSFRAPPWVDGVSELTNLHVTTLSISFPNDSNHFTQELDIETFREYVYGLGFSYLNPTFDCGPTDLFNVSSS